MARIIDFSILRFDGVPLFHYSNQENSNSQKMGPFFTALQSFAKELNEKKKGLEFISLGSSFLYIRSNKLHNLYFMARSTKEFKAENFLTKIETLFIDKYEENLANFDGEVSIFENFEPILLNKFKNLFS